MAWKVTSITPRNEWDYNVWIAETSWLGGETYRQFYGSGSTWWEIKKDRFGDPKEERVSDWSSGYLHDIWNNELNRQLQEKNTKQGS